MDAVASGNEELHRLPGKTPGCGESPAKSPINSATLASANELMYYFVVMRPRGIEAEALRFANHLSDWRDVTNHKKFWCKRLDTVHAGICETGEKSNLLLRTEKTDGPNPTEIPLYINDKIKRSGELLPGHGQPPELSTAATFQCLPRLEPSSVSFLLSHHGNPGHPRVLRSSWNFLRKQTPC